MSWTISKYIIIADAVFVLLLLFLIISTIIFKLKLKKRITDTVESGIKNTERIPVPFNDRILYLFSDYMEKLSRLYGINLPLYTGLDEIWIEKIKKHPGRKNLRRVLQYAPEKALFDVMNAVINKRNLRKTFDEWVVESGEFMILKKIALSGNGREFDGKKALDFFKNEKDTIIEMISDPLWQCRFFAASILVHMEEAQAVRVLKEAFNDSRDRIRILVVNLFKSEERDFIYGRIRDLFLNDPVFEVRKAAKKRIDRDFKDLYSIDPKKLSSVQKLHIIELLNTSSKIDENIGLDFMKEESSELQLYASRYLSVTGTLSRLFREADLGDMDGFNRIYSLLGTAVKSGITDFLENTSAADNPASLLIASRFLEQEGNRSLITPLLRKALAVNGRNPEDPHIRELFFNSIKCACSRGNDEALKLVNNELKGKRDDPDFQEKVLPLLPLRGDWIFIPALLEFMKDPGYPVRDELIHTLIRFPSSLYIPELISIIRSDSFSFLIKTSSLQVLGRLKNNSGIQYILENLPLLSLGQARDYAGYLFESTPDFFTERARIVLDSGDEKIRSRLIAALPKKEVQFFLDRIIKALSDISPEVRISAVKALSASEVPKALQECFPLLHDPVDEVRIETAKAVSTDGSKKGRELLKSILFDPSETPSVKRAVIEGLAESGNDEAFEMLTEKLIENEELTEETVDALSCFDNVGFIRKLFELSLDAPPKAHPLFTEILQRMGQKAEIIAEKILLEKDTPLRETAVEFLDMSGVVELTARKLAHRNPEERYRAAEFLSLIGSRKAYRSLITAAKDPSKKVRIEVIKAIDRLNSLEGNTILEDLKEDPDRKVRRYTVWALERAEARMFK